MLKLKQHLNKGMSLYWTVSLLFWLKTYVAYLTEFDLGVTGAYQHFLLFLNPAAITLIAFSASLYIKNIKRSRIVLLTVLAAMTLLLYCNILYYREFTDFLTLNILMGSNNVSGALFASVFAMLRPWDLLYWVDVILFTYVVFRKKNRHLAYKENSTRKRDLAGLTLLGVVLFVGNLFLAELDRPQLLTRTFDRNYIVKYLGLNFFTGYDIYQTVENNQIRARADESDLRRIGEYSRSIHAGPNDAYFGIAKDRNVVAIALESVQEFLIDFELEDENGNMHEVMPFVNSLFHSDESYSFENFFHQTGQGKSSDAEILAETSMFGLPQGSAFQTLGSSNTFHSTPNILKSVGYTTAAFHGNVGSFWNRTDTYQQFGYDYFFDSEFYDISGDRSLEYGLKDKLFFHDSAQYLEQLPQPFYSKFITVTHHFPYPLDEQNSGFPLAQTNDETINNYFATANYADQAIEEFFNYLKESGVYENTIFVLYGDHYGVSNMRNPHLAELVGEDPDEWGDFQNAQMQRVPLILHIPGIDNGQVFDTYSGQIDVLPTLMHLLGMETENYLFMGQDILSEEHNNAVTLRNGRVLTPEYSFIGQRVYEADTGENLTETLTEEELNVLYEQRDSLTDVLSYSDDSMSMDLLRFYTPEALRSIEKNDYQYMNQLPVLENEPNKETSIIEMNDGQSTTELYETDAPELFIHEPIEGIQLNETLELERDIKKLQ